MNSEEINQDELDQDASNKEMLLEIFYNSKGSIDAINAAIDAKLFGTRTRSITLFEKFVRARLTLNPKVLRLVELGVTPFEAVYLSQYPDLGNVEELDLRKNRKKIAERYEHLEHLKKISDRDLVMDLPDAIHVPSNVTGKNTNSIFNKLIRRLSQRAKKAISD